MVLKQSQAYLRQILQILCCYLVGLRRPLQPLVRKIPSSSRFKQKDYKHLKKSSATVQESQDDYLGKKWVWDTTWWCVASLINSIPCQSIDQSKLLNSHHAYLLNVSMVLRYMRSVQSSMLSYLALGYHSESEASPSQEYENRVI